MKDMALHCIWRRISLWMVAGGRGASDGIDA